MTLFHAGTILSLEWPNADLFRKTILVVKPKNGEKRTIPMNQKVFELFKAKARANQNDNKIVFASEAGTKIHRRNLMRAFYNATDRAKIADFHFHDLRHTFATRLAQAGIGLYQISKLLGHKDIKMTQRYSHHCPDSLRSGVEGGWRVRQADFSFLNVSSCLSVSYRVQYEHDRDSQNRSI